MIVKAPKNGFVVKQDAQEGHQVNAGDLLCEMDTEFEDQVLARLNGASALLNNLALQLGDDYVGFQRSLRQIAIDVATKYVAYAQDKATQDNADSRLSWITPIVAEQSQTALFKAQQEQTKATIASKMFEFSVQRAKEQLALARSQLASEIAFASLVRGHVVVKAPVGGKVSFFAAVGSFVKQGDQLAEVK